MDKKNPSRREFLRFLGLFCAGLLTIPWQKIGRIFSPKDAAPDLKEAKYYSRGDKIAG